MRYFVVGIIAVACGILFQLGCGGGGGGGAPGFSITTALPKGVVGVDYEAALEAANGTSPYTYTLVSGTLMSGVILNADGTFSGYPTTEGTYNFTIQVQDSETTPRTTTRSYSVVVSKVKWTFLVFMNADNNLESAGIGDINQMEQVGSTANLNIVVQCDRTPSSDSSEGYDDSNGDWTTCKRFYVKKDTDTAIINSQEIADLGEVDMGSAATLEDFVTWGLGRFKASHYAVILWNHGGAWKECSNDETDGSSLLIPDTAVALDNSLTAAGVTQFDLIGFDMCLMGALEVDYEISSLGLVRVASEELEPGDGWDYAASLGALAANPNMTAAQLGTRIAQDYKAWYDVWGTHDITLAAVDLTKIAALVTSVNNLASQMSSDMVSDWSEFGKSGKFSEGYAKGENPGGYIDLGDFAYILYQTTTNTTVETLASTVLQNLQQAVIYRVSGTTYPYSQGIAVYFPDTSDEYNDNTATYGTLDFATGSWPMFLAYYFTAEDAYSIDPDVIGLNVSDTIVGQGSPISVSATITGNYLVDVAFTIENDPGDGYYYYLNRIPLTNNLTLPNGKDIPDWVDGDNPLSLPSWESGCLVVTDGTTSEFAYTLSSVDTPNFLYVYGDYSRDGGVNRYDCCTLFEANTGSLVGIGLIVGELAYPVEPQAGDLFRPYVLREQIVTGDINYYPRGVTLTYGVSGFTLANSYLSDGDYEIGFEAKDVRAIYITQIPPTDWGE